MTLAVYLYFEPFGTWGCLRGLIYVRVMTERHQACAIVGASLFVGCLVHMPFLAVLFPPVLRPPTLRPALPASASLLSWRLVALRIFYIEHGVGPRPARGLPC